MTHSDIPSQSTARDVAEETKAAASDIADTVRSGAQEMAGKVTSDAAHLATKAQVEAADEVKSVASALRAAAEELRHGSAQERTFSQIADGLADASEAIRERDMGELMSELNVFARRNPMVFLSGAALIGFAATRFAKASGPASGGSATKRSSSSAMPSATRPPSAVRATDVPAPVASAEGA